jgi:thiol-disulfide isomerase/thioredoxin
VNDRNTFRSWGATAARPRCRCRLGRIWRRCGLAIALSTVAPSATPAAHAPAAGDMAPSFLGRTLDGHTISIGTYLGKVVVVSFWATWCPPCREELPVLENMQRAGRGSIQVIAVNTESRDVFRSAAKTLASLQLLLTNDVDNKGFNAYGVRGLPHLLVIGRGGRIVSVRSGYGRGETEDLADEINRALAIPSAAASAAPTEGK